MKISELIKELSEFNSDAEITLTDSENICLSYIYKDCDGNVLDKNNAMYVFIEPTDNCPMCTSEYWNGDAMWCSSYDCRCRDVEECYQFEEYIEE